MGILVPFSFVRKHYWKFDQSTPIKAFAKILHAEHYPKSYVAPCSKSFNSSSRRWGFFELQTFAIDLSDLRIWKKLRIANQLKILARFSDCIYPKVSIRSGTESSIFQWSAFVGLLVLCWPFFLSVSFISWRAYHKFRLEFSFDLRDHFFKENVCNNSSKHIRWTILDLPIDQGTH